MPLGKEGAFHQQEVSEFLRQLKLMAIELSNPVIAIAKEFNLLSNLVKQVKSITLEALNDSQILQS